MTKRETEAFLEKYKKEVLSSVYCNILLLINNSTSLQEVKENIEWKVRQNERRR